MEIRRQCQTNGGGRRHKACNGFSLLTDVHHLPPPYPAVFLIWSSRYSPGSTNPWFSPQDVSPWFVALLLRTCQMSHVWDLPESMMIAASGKVCSEWFGW